MNLYSKLVPAGRLMVVVHSGFAAVYWEAESAGAEPVFQLPSCEMDPAILIVWPNVVVVFELNATATVADGVAQPVGTAVDDAAAVVLDAGGVVPPEPTILMSAHVK